MPTNVTDENMSKSLILIILANEIAFDSPFSSERPDGIMEMMYKIKKSSEAIAVQNIIFWNPMY